MTTEKEPTTRDLMKRINELEAKLVPKPEPDINQLIRDQVRNIPMVRSWTGTVDAHNLDRKKGN